MRVINRPARVSQRSSGDRIVFDNVSSRNHLQGSLQATIRFAQSQIIPAEATPGDPQPHLAAGRSILLMATPLGDGSFPHHQLQVTVVDGSGNELGKRSLSPPDQLPLTAFHMEGLPDRVDFRVTEGSGYLIHTSDELALLADPNGAFLQEKLAQYPWVGIRTSDGVWVGEIHFPGTPAVEGKLVRMESNASADTWAYVGGRRVMLKTGQTLLYKRVQGRWIDESDVDNQRIVYAENTWSAELPGEWIQPGIVMRFDGGGLSGSLTDIEVGGSTELILHTIDIGMLTPPRDEFVFANDLDAHREYFQTVPVSRMVVNQYESVFLSEVMFSDGTLLTEFDPGEGGWQAGDMMNLTGWQLIAVGIDRANYGIHVFQGENAWFASVAAQVTVHNSIGKYANGIHRHGGLGADGAAILDESLGNEFSHEVGHSLGLGHFVGGFDGSIHRSAGEINSTWGWDADNFRFLPNFWSLRSGKETCLDGMPPCQPPFHGRSFGKDAMAGGQPMNELVRFTLYTPHVAASIQHFLESKAVFSSDSPTGFRRWDRGNRRMEPYHHRIDVSDRVIASNTDLSEATVAALLGKFNWVSVVIGDGDWAKTVHVPPASSQNQGRVFSIDHHAGWGSDFTINGQTQTIGNFRESYRSDGATWSTCIVLDMSMRRIDAPKDDLGVAAMSRLLEAYEVIHVAMQDGDWAAEVQFPPASAANRGRVVTVRNDATWATALVVNGLSIPLAGGFENNYVSDGERWNARRALEDFTAARRPKAFGVPVTTLMGYYDPEGKLPGYIYAALHGAYGFLYEDDGGSVTDADCQLLVVSGTETMRFKLNNSRLLSNRMNGFNINIPESADSRSAALVCDGIVQYRREIEPPKHALTYTINGG